MPEALEEITRRSFDILLTDLNLGEQGDGFTLVSAMRRVQPRAATVIITGFPQFESALNAIRAQVDEYLVKPSHPTTLVSTLRSLLEYRPLRQQTPLVRIFDVLRENKELVSQQWLVEVESGLDARQFRMSEPDRLADLPKVLDALIALGEQRSAATFTGAVLLANNHGQKRRGQGYFATLLADEMRILEKIVLQLVEQNLLRINLSRLFADLQEMNELFRLLQREAIRAFLEESVEPLG